MSRAKRLALLAIGLVAGVALAASFAYASARGGRLVRVTESDFRIKAPKVLQTGAVRLRVHNAGPDTHELLLVRLRGRLPLRGDGLTVDEEALERLHLVTVEGMQPGATDELDVKLRPGRYILFCNMAGHYLSGMHTTMVVR